MSKDSTAVNQPASPIESMRADITSARQLAGGESKPLTPENRKDIVVLLSRALRTLRVIERTYMPKGGQA